MHTSENDVHCEGRLLQNYSFFTTELWNPKEKQHIRKIVEFLLVCQV